jgi:poly(3-hydroxybutyrate) depolymerase
VRLDHIEFRGARGKIATSRVDVAGDKLSLTHRVPSRIGKDPYPLIITIPDAGIEPERHLETLFTQADQLENALVIAVQMPVNADVWNSFAPQEESGVGSVMTTYGAALQALPVDMNRVFLDGTGAGGGAAFATAAAFPHLFAGVIARGEGTPGAPANFGHIATLFMGGGDAAQGFADALRGLGYENCTLNAEGGEADVWAWIKEQKRTPYPAELAFAPSSAYTRTSYWVSVEGVDVDGGAKLNARVDREANTIDIQAEGIESLRIYFNDRLVDMDRPVRVVINGVASEAVVARNAKTLLDLVYQSGDWGRVFTNMQPYDVKGK